MGIGSQSFDSALANQLGHVSRQAAQLQAKLSRDLTVRFTLRPKGDDPVIASGTRLHLDVWPAVLPKERVEVCLADHDITRMESENSAPL